MKILFAGIIARYPFGGVTWCSLMYLLGLRALGHEVFYIEDTGECVYDPVLNTRATDPSYGTSYIHAALEPFGLGDRWSFVNYDGTYHGQSHEAVKRFCGRRRPVSQSVRRVVVLAGRVRPDSAVRVHRLGPGVHPAGHRQGRALVRRVLQALRPPVHLRSQHRHARLADSRGRFHLAPHVAAGRARRLADGPDARRPVHVGHDVADRELRRRRRQQGPGVREVHGPAGPNAAALRARHQRAADAAARARLVHGRRDGRLADALGATATSFKRSKAEFGVAKHTYVSTRSGWFSDRTECYLASGRPALVQDTGLDRRTCHPARDCSPSRRSTRPLAGLDTINGDYARHARARRRDRARALRRAPDPHADAGDHSLMPSTTARRCASRTSVRSPRRSRLPSPGRCRR